MVKFSSVGWRDTNLRCIERLVLPNKSQQRAAQFPYGWQTLVWITAAANRPMLQLASANDLSTSGCNFDDAIATNGWSGKRITASGCV